MLDEKKINECKKRIDWLIKKEAIVKEKQGRFSQFFLDNSRNSFDSAKLLYEVSTDNKLKKSMGFQNFNGFLWVINSSYYSMFYMARALLESNGVRIKTDYSLHAVIFDALVNYFYATGKIKKQILEEFQEATIEVQETLGKERAREIIEDYFYEREKRGRFTYEMGEIAIQNRAKTSLDRARKFNEVLRKMMAVSG